MKKNSSVILIISSVFVLMVVVGMIICCALLSNKDIQEWEYNPTVTKTDYRGDGSTEYSFNCTNEFKNAIKGYISKSTINFLGLNENVDERSERVLIAMQDAGVPASKLETITKVINENRLPTLLGNVEIPFNTVDEFSLWCDEKVLSLTDETLFSILGSFVHSFLDVTTLTEDELASFIYHYLDKNASAKYKLTLAMYEKDTFVNFLSDTFFAVRVLSQTKNQTGIYFGADALRSALYQLGRVYLDIVDMGDYLSIYKLFGFPEHFPVESTDENAKNMTETYDSLIDSIGKVVHFLGLLLTDLDVDTISSFMQLNQFNHKINAETGIENQKLITILSDEQINDKISPERKILLKKLLDERSDLQIILAQNFSKKINRSLKIINEQYKEDTLNNFEDLIMNMRIMLFYMSESNMTVSSLENLQGTLTNILTYSTELQDSLLFFQDKIYTLEDLKNISEKDDLIRNSSYFSDGGKLMELYVSSIFNIWITYKVNEWGIINNG